MRIGAYGATSAAASAVKTQPKASPSAAQSKPELKESDAFASSQLPPGVGEKLNIKA